MDSIQSSKSDQIDKKPHNGSFLLDKDLNKNKVKIKERMLTMFKVGAEWFQDLNTGKFVTWLKDDHTIRGEGANRSASTQAFLKSCGRIGIPKNRTSYRIRKIDPYK